MRMLRGIGAGALAMLTLSTCTHGVDVPNWKPATSPSGVMVSYRISGTAAPRNAELYAVDSAGVLLKDDALRRIMWPKLLSFDVQGLGSRYDVSSRARPDTAKVERLRLISRFPQGLDPKLLGEVLATLRLSAVIEVK